MADESGAGYVMGVVTGLLLGAAATLLLAPKRSELRQDLAAGASLLKDKAGDLEKTLANKAHDLKERGGELVSSARSQGPEALQEAAYYAEDVKMDAHGKMQDMAEGLQDPDKNHDVVESV